LRQFILNLVLGGLLLCSPYTLAETLSATEAAALYSEQTTYSIYRKGKKIGKHVLTITSNENRISVDIDSRITVRILKIPVFKFRYQSTERWENGQLVSVESITNTDKKIETASLKNEPNGSVLRNDSGESKSELLQYATNHWHIGAVSQANLFNTIKGTNSKVVVTPLGIKNLSINKQNIDASHYQYSGDIIAQSWYDKNQRWVKLAFTGTDGSEITYLIDEP